MEILKHLEEHASQVRDPDGYVLTAAARRQGGGGGGGYPSSFRGAYAASEDDERLRRRIGWLNNNAGLLAPLRYDQAAPSLLGVGIPKAMEILKALEEQAAEVQDPTVFVSGRAQAEWAAAASQHPAAASVPAYNSLDETKLRRRVTWMNHNLEFQSELLYSQVAAELLPLGSAKAMEVLKKLEEGAPQADDPT